LTLCWAGLGQLTSAAYPFRGAPRFGKARRKTGPENYFAAPSTVVCRGGANPRIRFRHRRSSDWENKGGLDSSNWEAARGFHGRRRWGRGHEATLGALPEGLAAWRFLRFGRICRRTKRTAFSERPPGWWWNVSQTEARQSFGFSAVGRPASIFISIFILSKGRKKKENKYNQPLPDDGSKWGALLD